MKFIHFFKKGNSEKVKYFLDLNNFVLDAYYSNSQKLDQTQIDNQELYYENIYKECGWELVYEKENGHFYDNGLNIHLWKKSYTDEKPMALTDDNSLMKFYRTAININLRLALNFTAIFIFFVLPFIKSSSPSYSGLYGIYVNMLPTNMSTLLKLIFIVLALYCLISSMKYYIKYKMLKHTTIYKS